MDRVAVIGAGLIGRSWSVVFARAGVAVALYDADPGQRAGAMPAIQAFIDDAKAAGLIAAEADVSDKIVVHDDLARALDGATYVQENVSEREDVKRGVFERLGALAGPDAILASSSSMMPVSRFTTGLAAAARCINAHPLNPPHLIPVVEIVPGPATSSRTVAGTVALMNRVKQAPVVLRREIAGFLVNRLQGALLNEAFRLVEDGSASVEDIDKAVSHGLGLRWSFMGPFETIDLNAPQGLSDYATRYGEGYFELAQERGAPRRWGAAAIAEAHRQRVAALPDEERRHRQAWRDERLLALRAHQMATEQENASIKGGLAGA